MIIDNGIIITGAVGIVTSIISSWTTWFLARKKYNSEVDSNLIENMQKSLSFYQKLSDDNKERLEEALTRSVYLEEEVKELRRQVLNLTAVICTDISCYVRKNDGSILKKKSNKDNKHEDNSE